MNDIDMILNKLLEYYDIDTMAELSNILEVSQPTISKWKTRNAIIPIKRRCKELGIYDEIFGVLNSNINNFQNSTNVVAQDFSNNSNAQHSQAFGNKTDIDKNILKLIDTLYSFAKENHKIEELKTDLSVLLTKYM